jgi:hypothetical protein
MSPALRIVAGHNPLPHYFSVEIVLFFLFLIMPTPLDHSVETTFAWAQFTYNYSRYAYPRL